MFAVFRPSRKIARGADRLRISAFWSKADCRPAPDQQPTTSQIIQFFSVSVRTLGAATFWLDGYIGSGDEIRDNVTRMRLHRSMLSFDHHIRAQHEW